MLVPTVWFGVASFVYILLFSRRTDVMSSDAQLSAMMSNYQISDFGKTLSLRSDLLFGAGGLQGGFLFWLDPVSVIGSIGGSTYNHFLVALVSSVVVFVLAAKVFDSFDVSELVGLTAAALTSIATLWGYSVALVDNELFGHVPQYASLLVVSLAILCCFLQINAKNRARDFMFASGFVISILFLFVVLPHLLVTSIPLLTIICTTSMLKLMVRREREAFISQLVLCVFTIALLLLLKAPTFLNGFYRYTAASEIPLSAYNQPQIWPPHNFVFETYFPTPSAEGNHVFQVFCFVALSTYLIRGVFDSTRRNHVWAASIVAAVFLFAYRIWQSTWDFESGPRISYFIWMLSPVYAIALTSLVADLTQRTIRSAYGKLKARGNWLTAMLCALALIALFISPITSLRFSLQEPTPRSLDELKVAPELSDRVSLLSGAPFRGRVAYVLQEPDYPLNISGRIPLLNDYAHTLTPSAFKFYEKFLLDADSPQLRNRFVFGLQNFDIYRMVGVRYLVVSKSSLDSRSQLFAEENVVVSELDGENALLDLGEPNLGAFSPVSVQTSDTLTSIFNIIESDSFNIEKSVVINGVVIENLISAEKATFKISNGDVSIFAESSGRSMILLPIEFSNCWQIESAGDVASDATLVRANGFLTGLVFDKIIDAKIIFRTGLFDSPTCRNKDLTEFRSLNS